MASLLIKVIAFPAILHIIGVSKLSRMVHLPFLYQTLLIGLILAAAGVIVELYILQSGTLWITTGVDFIISTLIVFLVPLLLPGARVAFAGALVTGALLTLVEIPQHIWFIDSGKTKKPPKIAE